MKYACLSIIPNLTTTGGGTLVPCRYLRHRFFLQEQASSCWHAVGCFRPGMADESIRRLNLPVSTMSTQVCRACALPVAEEPLLGRTATSPLGPITSAQSYLKMVLSRNSRNRQPTSSESLGRGDWTQCRLTSTEQWRWQGLQPPCSPESAGLACLWRAFPHLLPRLHQPPLNRDARPEYPEYPEQILTAIGDAHDRKG